MRMSNFERTGLSLSKVEDFIALCQRAPTDEEKADQAFLESVGLLGTSLARTHRIGTGVMLNKAGKGGVVLSHYSNGVMTRAYFKEEPMSVSLTETDIGFLLEADGESRMLPFHALDSVSLMNIIRG